MVRVKLVKLPECDDYDFTEEEKNRVGKVFEAFELDYGGETRFGVYLEKDKTLWYVPLEFCEVLDPSLDYSVEQETERLIRQKIESQPQFTVFVKPKKLLLIEDGSVDTTKLDNWDIPYICYRQGSAKPEIIDI